MNTTIQHLDKANWRICASSLMDHNYRHVWEFDVACADRVGAQSEHLAVLEAGEILGLADVRVKSIPVLGTGIAYINGGPLVRRNDDRNANRLQSCLRVLIHEYVERRGLVLRIMAPVGSEDWSHSQAAVFSEAGFALSNAMESYRTFLLDISKRPEEIRRNLAQKWRNCLNQSEKRGFVVRNGTSLDLFREFCDLFARFIERKQFEVNLAPAFYLAVHAQLAESDRFHISLAEIDGKVVAGHVASFLGDTCVYLLGASSDEGLQTKASYLLQWRVIQLAHEKGFKWYDLGGIDPVKNPGVYHFKSGLGGKEVTAPGPLECPATGLRQTAVHWSERAYRLLRRVKGAV